MTLNQMKTVRELAVEMPNATRVFEKLKIDYCCGGQRPLTEACAAAGVPLEDVLRLLEESGGSAGAQESVDLKTMPLTSLMHYIVDKHHVFTREEIGRLNALLDKVCNAHGQNHPELFEIKRLFGELANDLEPHMFKEERILFPYITGLEKAAAQGGPPMPPPFGTVRNPVRMMMLEHDTAGDILRGIRQASREFAVPPDVCISYQTLYRALEAFEQDLHQHIHLENNLLFPRAIELEDAI
jgi:regulator of cell morphogenesis and NO signaling